MCVQNARGDHVERGYAMVALLVMMAVMAIAMTVALPAWSTMSRREKEAELVFRGEQYARAIALFQRRYAGAFPPSIDVLVNDRYLRKKFKDPITNDDFQTIGVGETVNQPQTTDPLSPSGGRGRVGTQTGRGGTATGSAAAGTQAGRSTFTLGGSRGAAAQGGRAGGIGAAGASAGIMGVTSKSTAESIRQYKGADHYNQWAFIATQANLQPGGRGGLNPGDGVRGGAPPTPAGRGGPGGRGGRGFQPPTFPGTPFGGGQRGQQPPPPSPPGGRGRF
jgi:type II secretory pathway pseudopilin PulG